MVLGGRPVLTAAFDRAEVNPRIDTIEDKMMWLLVTTLLIQTADFEADGVKALDAKQYDAAVDLFTKAVAADPKDYAAHFHLALAYSLLGKDAEAIAQYKSTLELKSGLYEAELNIGVCMSRAKDPASAIPYLKSAAAQKPKEFRPAIYLAQALLEHGDFADAQAAFTSALAINAASAPAELGLGQSLARQNNLSEAEPHYRKAGYSSRIQAGAAGARPALRNRAPVRRRDCDLSRVSGKPRRGGTHGRAAFGIRASVRRDPGPRSRRR